jgi:methionyl aminopeptidase
MKVDGIGPAIVPQMIIGKSQKEIDKMRASGQLVGRVLRELRTMVEPGMTTLEVDQAAEKMIRDAVLFRPSRGITAFLFRFALQSTNRWCMGFRLSTR